MDKTINDTKQAVADFWTPFLYSALVGFFFGLVAVAFQYFAIKKMTKSRQLHKKRVGKGKWGATTMGTTVGGETTVGATTVGGTTSGTTAS
ncbi:hypothetical protein PRIPAC_76687 [Pristionchus pacificus]|uniref:Uncharacterized protein n=1 Tax=Pristionchus pacificus TaxID=54126 RepID=A0A2A6CFB7_PRIPA|nr:hypothetical protein PRIPAC_76687 [Pristionchus pacificus]|eukprot:PDM76777.1 hypothetical protein PRIPAC_42172 [Pristionchus pacificus]